MAVASSRQRILAPDRSFETADDAGTRAHKFQVPEVIFGIGTLDEVGGVLRRRGWDRPMVVSDESVSAAGWPDRAVRSMAAVGLDAAVWRGVTPNPKDYEVDLGLDAFFDCGADVLVAVGGGSCIDAAKAIALLSGNGGQICSYGGIDQAVAPIPPMVMLPSTGGSGADVSQFCVVTDTARMTKVTIAGRALVPDVSLTDPVLLTTMDAEVAAHTGIDALSHAIEAYVSLASDFLTAPHAMAATRGMAKWLLRSVEDPGDLVAKEGVARASLQAGMAFSNALLGATHAISHQIGGLSDLPHGLLNAILLPHVVRFNAEVCAVRYKEVAVGLGLDAGDDPSDAAAAVADHIELLAAKLGIPYGLSAVGVKEEHIESFVAGALSDVYMTTNPRPVGADDVRDICLAAL